MGGALGLHAGTAGAELAQDLERVDPCVVPVAPREPHGVVANLSDLWELGFFRLHVVPATAVALAHGAGAITAKIGEPVDAIVMIVPDDAKGTCGFLQLYLNRLRGERCAHV